MYLHDHLKIMFFSKESADRHDEDVNQIDLERCKRLGLPYHRERLSEKDHNDDKLDMICDSPNTANK